MFTRISFHCAIQPGKRPNANIIAVDSSAAALAIAQKNVEKHHCSNVELILSDWFNAMPQISFDLIVSNPPYIPADDEHLSQGDVRFEPKSALIASGNGLCDIQTIASQAKSYLKACGTLWFEHGYNQAQAVQTILTELNYSAVQTYHDLAGQARVTTGKFT